MSRHYDDDGLCRYCRRRDGEHKASCVLAPDPPLETFWGSPAPAVRRWASGCSTLLDGDDPGGRGAAEDAYYNTRDR